MAPKQPLISPSPRPLGNPSQPAPRIIENQPAKTLAAALANGKRQVDTSK